MSYRGNSKSSYGSQRHTRSIQSVQNARSSHARNLDSHFKAKLAKSPEQWMTYPSRFDLPEVDAPKPKEGVVDSVKPRQIYRLRKPIGNMTDEELTDYKDKLNKIWEREAFRSRRSPVYEKIFDQREQVLDEMSKRKKDREEMLLQMARSEQLHFDNTPDKNPFPYEYGKVDLRHDKLNPYVEAKEATKQIMAIREEAGLSPLDKEQVFKDYLAYYKKPYGYDIARGERGEKGPWDEYLEIGYKAEDMKPTVKNWVEDSAGKDGRANIYTILEKTGNLKDRPVAQAALNRLIKQEGWDKDGEWIKVREGHVEKPNVKGLVALDNLGAFTRSKSGATSDANMVTLDGNGKAKVNFMDPTRISMFVGEVDLSGLPGIKGHSGERAMRLEGGDEIALTSPSFGYTNKFGDIILKKTNVKSVRTEYDGSRYDKENARKVESRVTKEFKVNVHPIDPKNRKEYEQIPHPKFATPFELAISAKDLLDLTAPSKYTKRSENKSKWGPKDYTEVIALYTKNGKTIAVRKASRENEDDKIPHKWRRVETVKAEGNGRAFYNANYLRNLAEAAEPNEKIKIAYNTDMPLKAEVNNPTVKGTFYLAPRIATD